MRNGNIIGNATGKHDMLTCQNIVTTTPESNLYDKNVRSYKKVEIAMGPKRVTPSGRGPQHGRLGWSRLRGVRSRTDTSSLLTIQAALDCGDDGIN